MSFGRDVAVGVCHCKKIPSSIPISIDQYIYGKPPTNLSLESAKRDEIYLVIKCEGRGILQQGVNRNSSDILPNINHFEMGVILLNSFFSLSFLMRNPILK
jgi:hypothetical protein